MDTDGFILENPTEHIEIMNQHILVNSAGDLDVGHGRWPGIPAGDQQSLRLADFSGVESGFETRKSGIETTLKTDAAQNTGPGHRFSAEACPFQCEIYRFFTKNCLTCGCGPLDKVGVRVGTGGNHYGMDFGIAERLLDGSWFCAVYSGEF